MRNVSVRLNDEEDRAFSAYADLLGVPLSTMFKVLAEERLEDEFDLRVAEDFCRREERGAVEVRPIEEFFEELDL